MLRPFLVRSSSGNHFPYLDGLRGLAVLLVLVFHSWNASGRPSYRWKLLGAKGDLANLFAVFFTGVQLFFILSGFLLAQPWFRSDYFGKPRPSLKKYARLRWFRIAPAYYCALGFWVLLFIPLITPAPLFYSARGVLVFLLHLFLLENFLPIAAQYNATWWTIPVEALFYVLLPFGVCLFYRWRWLVTLPASLLVSIGWVLRISPSAVGDHIGLGGSHQPASQLCFLFRPRHRSREPLRSQPTECPARPSYLYLLLRGRSHGRAHEHEQIRT